MSSSQTPAAPDRRRHRRKTGSDGEAGCLTVAGLPAKLVDWSFGGLGLSVEQPNRLAVNEAVELRIFDQEQESWEALNGHIRRIEADGTLGVAFDDDGENTVRVLLRLLNNRLIHIMS